MEFLTDEKIMMDVKLGDTNRLSMLYEKHKKRFYNYFVKLTNDTEVSQDLLQNLFVRILKYKKSYQQQQPFLPWSYRIARNLVYDWSKKRSPLNVVLEVEKVADQVVDDGEAQQKADREEQLRKAIARLPAEKSELIFWTKIEGMKYEDVANIKDTTVGAIKVQVHRAMAQLKTLYFENNEA
ncbi:MAG: RNA polymerase sigma factor [Bacteroidota bacterium]